MYEPVSAPSRALYELRPLSTGEILDRTFTLYRRRFWLFCGLAAAAATLQTLMSILQLFVVSAPLKAGDMQSAVQAMVGGIALMVSALVYMAGYSVTLAATTSAVLSTYLGHKTSISQAFQAIGRRWFRYVLISFWWAWSAIWIFTLLLFPAVVLFRLPGLRAIGGLLLLLAFLSLIYGVVAYLRNSLAIPASVMEGLKVRASMRRSKTLAVGAKGRIFLLFLLLLALGIVAGIIQAPFAAIIAADPKTKHYALHAVQLVLSFVTSSLLGPIGAIGFCLFYIDQRVRLEGFDIEALMDPTIGPATPQPAPAPVELLPSGFVPSGFTAVASPFPPSEFAASAAPEPLPFAPSGFTAPPEPTKPESLEEGKA
jgi:hypothetical protein